jgi:ribosomal protein L40E
VKSFLPRPSASRWPLAVRSTLLAVGVALLASALASALFTMALHDTVGSGLVTFAIFGGLAALSAGVLAWELASLRVCPRCGHENPALTTACAGCGYDLRARPRYACSEGHRVAFEPGLCDCGRRLLALRPVPVARHALRAAWLALGFFLVVLVAAMLASGGS